MPHAPVCFFAPSQALRHRPKAGLIGGAAHRQFFLKVWLSEDTITQEMELTRNFFQTKSCFVVKNSL